MPLIRIALFALTLLCLPQSEAQAQAPDIGGPFNLESSRGGRLSNADLQGRPYALFFGFTRCPDVCPTTLSELDQVYDALGEAGKDLPALFVSIDPERDDPAYLANYLSSFDKRIIGLRGTLEETAALARAFKAVYKKVPLKSGDYTMEHTAIVYLIDRHGRFFEAVDYRAPHAEQLAAFRRLLASP